MIGRLVEAFRRWLACQENQFFLVCATVLVIFFALLSVKSCDG